VSAQSARILFVKDCQVQLDDADLSGKAQLAGFQNDVAIMHPVKILQLLRHFERHTFAVLVFNFVQIIQAPEPVFQESPLLFS
jgi:hypothetical protein